MPSLTIMTRHSGGDHIDLVFARRFQAVFGAVVDDTLGFAKCAGGPAGESLRELSQKGSGLLSALCNA